MVTSEPSSTNSPILYYLGETSRSSTKVSYLTQVVEVMLTRDITEETMAVIAVVNTSSHSEQSS